jgi:hypothetical protein
MPSAPYPLLPQPIRKSWIEQHPLWKIPLGCLTLFVLMGMGGIVLITVITGSFRHSDVYQRAVTMASGNSRVLDEIGQPIEVGWFVSGQLNINGSSGKADLAIPIKGPRGKANIRAVAYRSGGVWTFTWLQVNVAGHGEPIDQLSPEHGPGT